MWNKKLNLNVTTEMLEDLKNYRGFNYNKDIEENLMKLLNIKFRKKKIEKICGRITEEKQK